MNDSKMTSSQSSSANSSSQRPNIAEKRRTFRAMHESGCFVIPNPWDIGSARYLQGLGFKALASTSSGFAWSQGFPDSKVTRDLVLRHLQELVAATDVPINADFESGYAADPAGVAESVRLAIQAGVAGLSIEDSTGDSSNPLYSVDEACARIRAARLAIDGAGGDTLLVGRAEGFLHGRPILDEAIARLVAYSNAGADCLYAPGIQTREQIQAVVSAVAPKPVNLLIGGVSAMNMADVAALGVRRVSVGGALARTAWGAFKRAADELAQLGRFDGFAQAAKGRELNQFFADDLPSRMG